MILDTAGPAEVEARLRLASAGRQPGAGRAPDEIRSGDLVIDEATYSARLRGRVARPHLQGVRAAQVPRPAPRPGLHPGPAAAGGLGLRLLRRHPHRRRARPAAARQARPRARGADRHRPQRRLQVRAASLRRRRSGHVAGTRRRRSGDSRRRRRRRRARPASGDRGSAGAARSSADRERGRRAGLAARRGRPVAAITVRGRSARPRRMPCCGWPSRGRGRTAWRRCRSTSVLHLRYGGDRGRRRPAARQRRRSSPATPTWTRTDPARARSGELVVHPAHRRQRARAGARAGADRRGGGRGRLRLWAHGDLPGAARPGRGPGFERVRALWQMRRSLRRPAARAALAAGVDGPHLRARPGRGRVARARTAARSPATPSRAPGPRPTSTLRERGAVVRPGRVLPGRAGRQAGRLPLDEDPPADGRRRPGTGRSARSTSSASTRPSGARAWAAR